MGITRKEAEDLKPVISKAVNKILGFSDSAVVVAAINCLSNNLDKKSTIEHLTPLMDKAASKFVEELYNNIEDVKRSRKRKDRSEANGDAKKSRHFVEPDSEPVKVTADAPAVLSHQQIKMMMDQARQQIEQRKNQIKNMSPSVLSAKVKEAEANAIMHNLNSSESQQLLSSAAEKAQKAAEIQQRIQARLAAKPDLLTGIAADVNAKLLTMPLLKPPEKEQTAPTPLILDDQGRTIDSSGHLLQMPSRVPTLKANIRAKKREEFRQKLQEKPTPEMTPSTSKYFDTRVKPDVASRQRRNFKFHEKGRFVQIAQKIRTKSQLQKLQSEIAQAAKRTGIQQASKLALITPRVSADAKLDAIPDMEWWDDYIVNRATDVDEDDLIVNDVVTNLIEHPTQIAAPGETNAEDPVLGTYMTKKERKKLRRMNRREALKDEQEKIRLGLVPAPEPKVKLSNLMRVLGTDAVQDPTKVEKHVRQQMAKRQKAHEQANAARKLTTEQRKDKRIRKLKEDTSNAVHVAMYRVASLRDPAKKFKIEMNSKQLYMTGCTVMHPDINVVIVEGGPKAQRKFNRLMTIRIKWDEDKKGKKLEEPSADMAGKLCELIWEGHSGNHHFGNMTFKQCTTDEEALEFFRKHGVEQYWKLAHSQKLLEE